MLFCIMMLIPLPTNAEAPPVYRQCLFFLSAICFWYGIAYLFIPGTSTSWANLVISGSSSGKDSSVFRI